MRHSTVRSFALGVIFADRWRAFLYFVTALAVLGCVAYLTFPPTATSRFDDVHVELTSRRESDSALVIEVLQRLIKPPQHEVGGVAICASLRTEGRWIQEWLLYVSRRPPP